MCAVQAIKRIYSLAVLREIEVTYRFRNIDCDITGRKLESPELVYAAFDFLKYLTKEQLIVINLNSQHAIMNYETIATGSVNGVNARVSEVLRTQLY